MHLWPLEFFNAIIEFYHFWNILIHILDGFLLKLHHLHRKGIKTFIQPNSNTNDLEKKTSYASFCFKSFKPYQNSPFQRSQKKIHPPFLCVNTNDFKDTWFFEISQKGFKIFISSSFKQKYFFIYKFHFYDELMIFFFP